MVVQITVNPFGISTMPWILLNHVSADFRALWQWTLCTCVVIPVEYAELRTLLGISKHNVQQFVVTILFASSEELAYSWSWWLRFPNLIEQSEIIAVMNTISALISKACFSLGRLKSWRRECGQWHWAASCIWCVTIAAYIRRQRLNGLDIRVRTLPKTCWETVT